MTSGAKCARRRDGLRGGGVLFTTECHRDPSASHADEVLGDVEWVDISESARRAVDPVIRSVGFITEVRQLLAARRSRRGSYPGTIHSERHQQRQPVGVDQVVGGVAVHRLVGLGRIVEHRGIDVPVVLADAGRGSRGMRSAVASRFSGYWEVGPPVVLARDVVGGVAVGRRRAANETSKIGT